MPITTVANSLFLFLLAGLCEIGGGWLVWEWLREAPGLSWGIFGGAILILYGIVPTFQPAHFGRIYAAYGGFSLSCRFCGVGHLMGISRTGLMLLERS
jgi:small multidrug resistance family-3 protein